MTSDNDRLRAVFLKRSKISQREFGERYGIGTAGMVNQLLLGRRPVSLAAAVKFAEGLGCAIDDFSPELAAFARKAASFTHEIETDIDSAIHPNRIPVLTGEEVASRSRGKEDEPAGWTLTDHRMAEGSFALRIEDTQMEPHFTAGDIVIIEPIAPAAGAAWPLSRRVPAEQCLCSTLRKRIPFPEKRNLIFCRATISIRCFTRPKAISGFSA